MINPCFTWDPALNAKNPKMRMNPPRDVRGMECPEMYLVSSSLNRSILGPSTMAPETQKLTARLLSLNLFYPN